MRRYKRIRNCLIFESKVEDNERKRLHEKLNKIEKGKWKIRKVI